MKVCLAVQPIATNSVAKALRWAHSEQIEGFQSDDVVATAEFEEIHDQVFDILNSRHPFAYGIKAAISERNIDEAEKKLFGVLVPQGWTYMFGQEL